VVRILGREQAVLIGLVLAAATTLILAP